MAILATFDDEELDRLYTEVALTNIVFDTGVVGNSRAVQQRTVNRYDAIRTYDIQYGGMQPDEQLALNEFFITKQGKAIGFRFYPPFDREFDHDLIGLGDGVTTVFYLKRNYVSRNRFITRRILKPIHPLLTVTVNGQKVLIDDPDGEITPEGDYAVLDNPITVDWNQGKITFATPPTNGHFIFAETGEYHVPVYFDSDSFSASDYGPFADAESVRLVEIAPSALDASGNALPDLTLGFVTPLANSLLPDTFNVSLTSTNVDTVLLYTTSLVGVDGTGPTFNFTAVTRPATGSDGTFELVAIGANGDGGVVMAKTTLGTLPGAPGAGLVTLLLDENGDVMLDGDGNVIKVTN